MKSVIFVSLNFMLLILDAINCLLNFEKFFAIVPSWIQIVDKLKYLHCIEIVTDRKISMMR